MWTSRACEQGNTLLYRIAQTGALRTYINVPQTYVNSVHVGQAATLTVAHLPGRSFRGKVARTANALDPATRTMLVEVDVPNADGALFPGTCAEVDLSGPRANPPPVVPAAAIIFGAMAPRSPLCSRTEPCICEGRSRAGLRRPR
jgi:multidrug efflux pump subunit AcrA (membrane-fusion protein)